MGEEIVPVARESIIAGNFEVDKEVVAKNVVVLGEYSVVLN